MPRRHIVRSAHRSLLVAGVVLVALVATACPPPAASPGPTPPGSPPVGGTPDPTLGGCPLMPADNYWSADVSTLPVHARSAAWVNSIGRTAAFHPDFGSGTWNGGPIGIPYTVVGASQPKVPVSFSYSSESDPGPYPLPWDAPVEGGQQASGDRHVIVVDRSTCRLYEMFDARRGATTSSAWSAGSGAVFDLRSNAMRPAGWTSADAAGLPILPGLVRFDEVAAGRIDHAIRFTAPVTQRAFVWPARHFASSNTDPNVPPMGAWFRLRSDYPTAGLHPHARTIVEAMQRHGVILADNGSSWYMSGAPDERWDNAALRQLKSITGADMMALDTSSLMGSPDSGQSTR